MRSLFLVSSAHKNSPAEFEPDILINPWKPWDGEKNNYHPDWLNYDRDLLISELSEFVENIFFKGKAPRNWFLIWIPIRSKNYQHNPKRLISLNFFIEDYIDKETNLVGDIFGKDLQNNLQTSFPLLKSLESFEIQDLNQKSVIKISKDNLLAQKHDRTKLQKSRSFFR